MEQWQINGGVLEYIDETHTYLYDGIVLPSITQLLICAVIVDGKKIKSDTWYTVKNGKFVEVKEN